jgi:diamine N-acetyltransferase
MPGMLLRDANRNDVPLICSLERRPEYHGLVGSWPEDEHLRRISDPDARYVIAEDQPGEIAGFAILFGLISQHRSIELKRIVVATPGMGHGKEMPRQIIRKTFDEYGAHRLWLDVFEHNLRAQRAYADVGFRREGVLREAVYRGGEYHSLMLMSILDREYREITTQREDLNNAKAAP